jgi:hypothetical protein
VSKSEGDKLILDPSDVLTKKRTTRGAELAVEGRKGVAASITNDLDYDVDDSALRAHIPGVRLDIGGRPVEKPDESSPDGLTYDPDDTAVRAGVPSVKFGIMTGRDTKEDDGPREGDVLELQPNIDLLRRSVPRVVLTGTGHELELKGTITDGCDYDPNDDATKPRAFAADFTHVAWREDDPEPDLDGPEAGDYDINSDATQQRTDRGAAFSQLSGREEHEEDVVEDDKDYDPDLDAVKPRLKGVPQMDKPTGRDEEDDELDYRDYESEARAAQPTPAGAVVFDRQSGNGLCF